MSDKLAKAQRDLVDRVRTRGPLRQENTEDGPRFFISGGGDVNPVTAKNCLAKGLSRAVGDGMFGTTQSYEVRHG